MPAFSLLRTRAFYFANIVDMSSLVIKNAAVVMPGGTSSPSDMRIENGVIAAVSEVGSEASANAFDVEGRTAVPGFVDVHIHGAVGIDVNESDAAGLMQIAEFLAANGVTAWVPTLVPDSDKNYARVIGEIGRLMEMQEGRSAAQAVGVHYEGVFASEKMCGALRPEYFKKFTGREVSELPRLKRGIHMTTFAPEVEGGVDLARELTANGWIASIGHTSASPDVLDRAFEAGARHLTHFYNAMTGLHHRNVGVVGWALTKSDVTFDIIADGMHVHPKMLAFACRSKTPEKVTLISDSVAPTGLGDGEFELWGEKITVTNGITKNERGSIAGSVITMLDAFRRMLSLGFSPEEASRMASLNPAKLLGVSDSRGSIEVGKRADIVVLEPDGSVYMTVVGGAVLKG